MSRSSDERTGHGLVFAEAGELLAQLDWELASAFPRERQEKQRAIPIAIVDGRLLVATDSLEPVAEELARESSVSSLDARAVTAMAFRRLQWSIDRSEVQQPERPPASENQIKSARVRVDGELRCLPLVEVAVISVEDPVSCSKA